MPTVRAPVRAPRASSRLLAAAVVVLAGLALAGCSGGQSKPVKDYTGEPRGVDAPASSAGGASWAAWLDGGKQFGIVLYGSSTCPPTIASVSVVADNQLKATPAAAPGGVCTHDYVPHTTVFDRPAGVTTTSDVTIKLPDSTLTLPGLRG